MTSGVDPAGEAGRPVSLRPAAYFRGWRAAFSFAGLILCFAFIGFGAFARDAGFAAWQVATMAVLVWALPSKVVFVASIAGGASLPAAGLAVTLSAVRLMPMTIVLMPALAKERARRIWLYLASHFIAVTGYVEALLRLPNVPSEERLSFFLGLGTGLLVNATLAGLIGHLAAGLLPLALTAALVFLTPMYFILSMLTTSTSAPDRLALAFGIVLAPIAHAIEPELDLLWAGLVGGTLAYGLAKARKKVSP